MERLRNGSVTVSTVAIDGYSVSKVNGNVSVYTSPLNSKKETEIAYPPSAVPSRGIADSLVQVN